MGIAAYLVNQSGTSNEATDILYKLYTTLYAGGWRKVADSDGTTRSGTGAQLTGSGAGANGFGNANAWWILKQPTGGTAPYSGNRTITCKRTSANSYSWWYTQDGVLGTVGSATTPDSGTNTVALVVAQAATYSGFGTRYHIIVSDAAENFGWWIGGWQTGGASLQTIRAFFDPCRVPDPLDTDPFVLSMPYQSASVSAWSPSSICNEGSMIINGYLDHLGPNQAYSGLHGLYYRTPSRDVCPNLLGQNPEDAKHNGLPLVWDRNSTLAGTVGYKGMSSLMRWGGVAATNGQLYNIGGVNKSHVRVDDVILRWNETSNVTL